MSEMNSNDSTAAGSPASDGVDFVIVPRARDLGGFEVRRALPARERRMVGPFIFFDQMGPAQLGVGQGMDVRPHPHIGLATLTYLFEGEIMHRDSLGNEIAIRPGELNWMTAGRGIVHSERTPPELRATGSKLWGIQSWVALAANDEETAPAFVHHDGDDLPVVSGDGVTARIIAGELAGAASPVATSTETFYADVSVRAGAVFPFDFDHDERAVYVVAGEVEIGGDVFGPEQLLVFRPGDRITIAAQRDARFMALGGEPMDGPRYIWWNFVSSSRKRIEQAKEDWKAGRFDPVPNDSEFIPLPGENPKPVDYP